jgi:ABC-type multidrug transport system ATPase subunit
VADFADQVRSLREGQSLTIGAGTVDVRMIGDGVDAKHARLTRRDRDWFLQDVDSAAGTFVNSIEVRGMTRVKPGDVVRLGRFEFRFPEVSIGPDRLGLDVAVASATKSIGSPSFRVILDQVSFDVCAGQFIGIVGASGSGKSTLVRALAGLSTLTSGEIRIDGVAQASPSLRFDRRIAYLPQDIVIHEALAPSVALDYVACIKLPESSAAQRADLVAGVLKRVGLEDRGNVPAVRLSGGQRKRVALAGELIGDPRLLIFDEATSGLDPATEAEMMELFRSLAAEGRTVLVVTHFPGRLHQCDGLLVMADGKCVFRGPPAELLAFFQVAAVEDVYLRLREKPAEHWLQRFASRPSVDSRKSTTIEPASTPPSMQAPAFWAQAADLTLRYCRIQLADPRTVLLLLLQAPVIGLMISATFGNIRMPFVEQHAADSKQVLFVLVIAVLWCSGTLSVREIVKEWLIVRHEARFGLDLKAYLLSKVVVLGTLSLAQTALLLATVRSWTQLSGPLDLQFAVLATTSLVGTAFGLCVSSGAATSERAMTVLPVALIGQAVFSGGLARLAVYPAWIGRILSPAYWGIDGLKATLATDLAIAVYPGAPGHFQPPILGVGGPMLLDLAALVAQGALFLAAAAVLLSRRVSRY